VSFNGRDDESRLEITRLDDEPSINLNDCRGGIRPPLFQRAFPYGEPRDSTAMLTIAEIRFLQSSLEILTILSISAGHVDFQEILQNHRYPEMNGKPATPANKSTFAQRIG